MAQHKYRITVESMTVADNGDSTNAKNFQFEVENHDDILQVVERLQGRGDFDPGTAAAFGLGLKLFGEVMLKNKDNSLFSSLQPHFGQFMRTLKKDDCAS
ncbi:DUF3861 domain-containing protein [uncultured Desulfosarcina sp.]|uniref:DUF3861 domain-containing protein n=1 Tax=uncultured Desulfosarcina sp. TaxID=218289 RepID=UPI0029C76008|nr:DUF3861 domain-containing protein [uncultured Desulfosarcina sp.]